jgi:hypothetical protein
MNWLINNNMYEYYQSATGTGYYKTYWGGHKSYNYTYYYGVYADYVGTQNYNSSQWNSLSAANQGSYQSQSYIAGWYSTSPIYNLLYNTPTTSTTPINNNGTYTLVGQSLEYNGTYYTLSVIVPSASITTSNVTQSSSTNSDTGTGAATLINNGTSTTTQTFTLSTTLTDTGSTTTAYGLSAGITASLTEAVTLGNKDVATETTSATIAGSLNANYNTTNAQTTSSSQVYTTVTTLTAEPGQTAVAQYTWDFADTYMDWSGPGTLTSSVGNYVVEQYSAQNFGPISYQYAVYDALQYAINYGIPTAAYINPSAGTLLTGGTVYEGTGYNITTTTYNYSNNNSNLLSTSLYVESDSEDSSIMHTPNTLSVLEKLKSDISLKTPLLTKKIKQTTANKELISDSGWKLDHFLKEASDSTGNDQIFYKGSGQYMYAIGGGKDIIKGSKSDDYLGIKLVANSNINFDSGDGNDVVFVKRNNDDKSHFDVDFSGNGSKTIKLDQTVAVDGTKPTSFDHITIGKGPADIIIENFANLHISNFKFGVDCIRWDKSYKVSLSGPSFILKTVDGKSQVILRNSINSLLGSGSNPLMLSMLNPEIFNKDAIVSLEPTLLLNKLALHGLTNPLRRSWQDVQASRETLQAFVKSSSLGNKFSDQIIGNLEKQAINSSTVDQYWKSYSAITGKPVPYQQSPDLLTKYNLGFSEPVIGYDYIVSYPDLIKALGNNLNAGIKHFYDFGRSEGRRPDLFNDMAYFAANPDVAKDSYYGSRAAEHYLTHGIKEGRKIFYI